MLRKEREVLPLEGFVHFVPNQSGIVGILLKGWFKSPIWAHTHKGNIGCSQPVRWDMHLFGGGDNFVTWDIGQLVAPNV